ncbi:HEAT repeat domain-containing protein [Clostridium sp. D2Q-11]|uniref:HEAT repeat domain-containing protein n=1 Tax=Anaeromonas frigoriresistens TaxID=2683708 RepID=A0A942ZAB1_9FIRM|nr:HEAT repeat domain-containing protein [Anaeromonas frigoriresistens]MBS4539630.1 HEAT repeat domain-containing protein [Anaeromonas frigoriresistens]
MILKWSNIDKMESFHISYLLYSEGKSIEIISKIRNIPHKEVEKHIIEGKIKYSEFKKNDRLINIISMEKSKRVSYLNNLSEEEIQSLTEEIYKRYIKFKNPEDRMILIWLIGEIKDEKLVPFLKMELKSKNVNFRRLACSALGKIGKVEYKEILEGLFEDKNPQVKQYAIKSLRKIGDNNTISLLEHILQDTREKDYVKRAAKEVISEIKDTKSS